MKKEYKKPQENFDREIRSCKALIVIKHDPKIREV